MSDFKPRQGDTILVGKFEVRSEFVAMDKGSYLCRDVAGVNGDGAPCPVVIYVNNSGALDYAPVDLIELIKV